jgi:hypothetical protein
VTPDLSVTEAAEQFQPGTRALLVIDARGQLDGIVTLPDVEQALLANQPGATVGEVASRPVVTVFPDESLSDAVRRMGLHGLGQVPVVARSAPRQVVGLLRRSDVVQAYAQAMRDQLEAQRHRPIRPEELRGTQLVETTVAPGSPLASRRLSELALPQGVLVVTLERGPQVIVPRGDTELHAGDRMVLLVERAAVANLHEHLAELRTLAGAGTRANDES